MRHIDQIILGSHFERGMFKDFKAQVEVIQRVITTTVRTLGTCYTAREKRSLFTTYF